MRLNDIPCVRLGRLNADGTTDTTFNLGLGFNNTVSVINVQADGKILVGGDFTSFNGLPHNRIVRLNPDGTIDPTFVAGNGANNNIYSITMQPDGKIIVAGAFTSFNSNAKSRVCRLNPDGSIDVTFSAAAAANNSIYASAVQPDGKILLGGNFTTTNSVARNRIARINADGSLDTAFDTAVGANNSIKSICLQTDGKIVIGGAFETFNNVSTPGAARLNANGSIDTSFNCTSFATTATIYDSVFENDGKIVLAGVFPAFDGFTGNNILRLNADGSLDDSFISGTGFDAYVTALAQQADGKILAGGNFALYNRVEKRSIARLYGSTTLGLEDFDSDEKITFYPNPVNDYLKVSNDIAISHFEVFDITGKKIDSNVFDENIIDV